MSLLPSDLPHVKKGQKFSNMSNISDIKANCCAGRFGRAITHGTQCLLTVRHKITTSAPRWNLPICKKTWCVRCDRAYIQYVFSGSGRGAAGRPLRHHGHQVAVVELARHGAQHLRPTHVGACSAPAIPWTQNAGRPSR